MARIQVKRGRENRTDRQNVSDFCDHSHTYEPSNVNDAKQRCVDVMLTYATSTQRQIDDNNSDDITSRSEAIFILLN